MSEKMSGLDEARAALAARFEDTWRRVWNRDPLKSQIEGFIKAEVDAAVKVAREDAEANAKRAEAAEAEVARLKALLEQRPAWPYTPRVGDVVLFDGERRDSAEELPRIVTTVEPDGWWSCVHINRRGDVAAGPFRLNSRINCAVRLHRLATPAERAAAGLPAEAPAAPRVLKEHLAYLEAHAAWWSDGSGKATDAQEAARALVAAVARRDGGGK